uniref:FXYD domain-containing ion transport regulator n=1 Tax=Pygocentrus nattereri TaxID=42514 RepID=A0AAR2KNB2_PYGNA
MKGFTALVLLTVFSAFLSEAEANPFVYNYDRLRIGGIIFTILLVIGAIFVLFHDKCGKKKKDEEEAGQI